MLTKYYTVMTWSTKTVLNRTHFLARKKSVIYFYQNLFEHQYLYFYLSKVWVTFYQLWKYTFLLNTPILLATSSVNQYTPWFIHKALSGWHTEAEIQNSLRSRPPPGFPDMLQMCINFYHPASQICVTKLYTVPRPALSDMLH